MTAIELDSFRDLKGTPFDFRTDDLSRALDARLARDRPVILEGVTVLQVLDHLSLRPDYLVLVEHDDPDLDPPALELERYFQRFEPKKRADYCFKW